MALPRTKLIVLAALVALVGAGAFVLTSEDRPLIPSEATRNVLRIEAAGVNYGGWPEMGIIVNGQDIGSLTIDSQQRKMFSVDVPSEIEDFSIIEIKFTNYTEPQSAYTLDVNNRAIIFRGLYLNDKKLEGGIPSGEGNTVYSLKSDSGGITWHLDQ